MSMTLFYAPATASFSVHWMLIELGLAFDVERVDFAAGEQKSAAYLKLNPAGRVPTLVIDGTPHTESAALLMLLAERHPDAGFAPMPGQPGRAAWLETMVFLANTLGPAMRDWFYADKDGDPAGAEAVRSLARTRVEGTWDRLDAMLADGRPYLLGDAISTRRSAGYDADALVAEHGAAGHHLVEPSPLHPAHARPARLHRGLPPRRPDRMAERLGPTFPRRSASASR